MLIYTVGSTSNEFFSENGIRRPYLVDVKHTGDNIDTENNMYCELCALYHLWKNTTDDIVGLEHYRRIFYNTFTNNFLQEYDVHKYLENYDVIMTYKNKIPSCKNIKADLATHLTESGVNKVIKSINKVSDKELANWLEKFLERDEKNGFNLFITKRPILNKYCEWLFKVIDDVKINTKLPDRSYGYISEFLMSGFFEYFNYKIKELPILFNDKGKITIGTICQAYANYYK